MIQHYDLVIMRNIKDDFYGNWSDIFILLKPFITLRNIHFFKLFLFIYSFKFFLLKTVIKPNFMIKKINVTFTQKFKQMRLQLNKKEKLFFFIVHRIHTPAWKYAMTKECLICVLIFNIFLFFYLQPWPLVVRSPHY